MGTLGASRHGGPLARGGMAYAAFLSGVVLAHAGLGAVHGLASPIGGYFPAPHGAVCGILLAPSMKYTIRECGSDPGRGRIALGKCARAGALVTGKKFTRAGIPSLCEALVETLYEWTKRLAIPRLGAFGVMAGDAGRIALAAENKNNPVALGKEILEAIVRECI